MPAGTTEIIYISGIKGNRSQGGQSDPGGIHALAGIGFLADAPDPNNADSEPPLSFYDHQWGCADWQLWHQANVTRYGLAIANNKFTTTFNQLNHTVSNAYNWCKYNCDWVKYFADNGIDVSDVASRAVCTGVHVVDASGNVIDSTADAVVTVADQFKWLLPLGSLLFLVGAGILVKRAYFDKPAVKGLKKKKAYGY